MGFSQIPYSLSFKSLNFPTPLPLSTAGSPSTSTISTTTSFHLSSRPQATPSWPAPPHPTLPEPEPYFHPSLTPSPPSRALPYLSSTLCRLPYSHPPSILQKTTNSSTTAVEAPSLSSLADLHSNLDLRPPPSLTSDHLLPSPPSSVSKPPCPSYHYFPVLTSYSSSSRRRTPYPLSNPPPGSPLYLYQCLQPLPWLTSSFTSGPALQPLAVSLLTPDHRQLPPGRPLKPTPWPPLKHSSGRALLSSYPQPSKSQESSTISYIGFGLPVSSTPYLPQLPTVLLKLPCLLAKRTSPRSIG